MKNFRKPYIPALAALFLPALAVAAAEEKPAEPALSVQGQEWRDGLTGAYLSSQFAKTSGDLDKAAQYLRRVYDNHPYDADIASQLQHMLLLSGKVEEAVAVAEKMPPGAPGNSVSSLLLSLRSVKQGNMERADGILFDAFGDSNGQLWLPLVSAWLDVARTRPEKPLTLEDLKLDPTRAPALINYHLALLNAYNGFTDAAAVNFKSVIDDPANPPSHIMQVLLAFYRANKEPSALKPVVDAYFAANPDAGSFSQSPIATPQDGIAEVLFTMGSVMHSAGVPQDAVIYLQLSRYLKPDLALASLALADVYSDFRQYERANALYKSLAQSDGLDDKAQLRLAVNLNQMGNLPEALALLDTMSRKAPAQYEPLIAKGDLLRTRLKFAEAVEAYSQAIKRIGQPESRHWAVFFARGASSERLGKWKDAEQDMQRALALKPDQPDVLNYLGYGWLMRGENIQEARAMIERAVKQRPNDPQIADSMGWALVSLEKYGEAVTYLEKALELLPGDPTINDHLGDTYWYLGRKVEARYQWERALTFSPEAPDAEAIRKKLKDGLTVAGQKPAAPVVAESNRSESLVP